jgi:hypothetical protein
MTNERHLLTKREALLSSPDVRRLGMSFRLMPGARIALTPVKGARETPTGEPVAVSSGNRSEFGEGSLEPLSAHGEALLQHWSHFLQDWSHLLQYSIPDAVALS